MPPSNDPVAGRLYIICIFGTSEVLTAVGENVRLWGYNEKDSRQIWKYSPRGDKGGFINLSTNRYLGRTKYWDLCCANPQHGLWEFLIFDRVDKESHRLFFSRQNASSNTYKSPAQREEILEMPSMRMRKCPRETAQKLALIEVEKRVHAQEDK